MTTLTPSLDGPILKLKRSVHHLRSLDGEIVAYIKSDPAKTFSEYDDKAGEYIGRVKVIREPPHHWGVLVAEYGYQLRSALDLLVYQLALLSLDGPGSRTAFPIFNSATDYARDRNKYLSGVAEEHRAIIDSLQPYHRGDDADNDPLARLQWLTNEDKHRLIVPALLKRGETGIDAYPVATEQLPPDGTKHLIFAGRSITTTTSAPERLYDSAEIGRVEAPKDKVNVSFDLTYEIAFGERPVTWPQFSEVGEHVGGIVRSFIPAFG